MFVMSCIHYMCLSRQSFFLQPCMHNYVNCFHLEASLVYINGITMEKHCYPCKQRLQVKNFSINPSGGQRWEMLTCTHTWYVGNQDKKSETNTNIRQTADRTHKIRAFVNKNKIKCPCFFPIIQQLLSTIGFSLHLIQGTFSLDCLGYVKHLVGRWYHLV